MYENTNSESGSEDRKKTKDVATPVNANTTVIKLKTIPNQMKYSITEFEVKAGASLRIVFENNDFMQHNLIIVDKGGKIKVGKAADAMSSDADAAERNYIPDSPEILQATAIVNPDETAVLNFTAPSTPGNYPYLCTFPGHWRIMQGNMKVVE